MEEEIRKTGVAIIGDAPWGTHLCQFYQTKDDLIDILVPYFKAGLENNEFCMWVTSKPLDEKEAKNVLRKAVPNFGRYLKRGQIEIVPHTKWYFKDGAFNLKRVLDAWIDKLNQALSKGYHGIRVSGNTAWLEKRDWRNFTDYEQEVNNAIGKYQMLAICTYALDKCGASEVIDVVSNHQFALIRRGGKWELIESSERKWAEEELKTSRQELRNLATHLQSVREEERTTIAREIHDELGQALTALKMDLSWLNKKLPQDQKSLLDKTKSMSQLLDATIQQVKRISTELRPGLLDDVGLTAAIEWQAQEFQNRTGIKCDVTFSPEDIPLDIELSTAVFRVLQETLTNVARHANATRVKLSLKEKSGQLLLKVQDNGKGITKKQISNPRSFGLIGMRERIKSFGGEIHISGSRGKGTTVTVNVPVAKQEQRNDKNAHRRRSPNSARRTETDSSGHT